MAVFILHNSILCIEFKLIFVFLLNLYLEFIEDIVLFNFHVMLCFWDKSIKTWQMTGSSYRTLSTRIQLALVVFFSSSREKHTSITRVDEGHPMITDHRHPYASATLNVGGAFLNVSHLQQTKEEEHKKK